MHTFIKLTLSATALAVCFTSSANDNKRGIEFYNAGLLNTAKSILKDNLKKGDVDKAEACYYLGEIYYDSNVPDSASFYYKEGLIANPLDPFNQIGQAKLSLKSTPEVTIKAIETIVKGKTSKKNPAVWIAAAKAFFTSGASKVKAMEYIEKAKLINEKYPETYVLEGDIFAADKDYGNASSLYEQAIYFDPNCYQAYLKSSRIYAGLNINSSIDMMKRLLEIYPKSPIAEKELAELYYQNGQFGKAKEVYAEHMKSGFATTADKIRYANILQFAEDYNQSLSIVKKLLVEEPNNFVLKRLLMYNLYNLKDTVQGLTAAKDFMKSGNKEEYITKDFVYYGYLLADNKEGEPAISAFQSALKMDSTKIDLYKEIGNVYEKMNNYQSAIPNYTTYLSKLGDGVTTQDYLNLGKVYYNAGYSLDSSAAYNDVRLKYYLAADSLFKIVTERAPEGYQGSLWTARTNSLIDPTCEKGLAKPFYETAAAILLKEDKPQILIECYRYLGYYHYIKEELEQSKEYWNKILTIDPANEVAIKALEGIKGNKKK